MRIEQGGFQSILKHCVWKKQFKAVENLQIFLFFWLIFLIFKSMFVSAIKHPKNVLKFHELELTQSTRKSLRNPFYFFWFCLSNNLFWFWKITDFQNVNTCC